MPSAGKILVDCVRQYCYLRERKYCPFDDLNDFWYVVKVKENAPQLLWRGLSRAAVDVVATGDYQAAEKTFEASRRTLEVCPELDNAAGQRVGRTRRRRGRSRSCLSFGRATGAGRGADLSDDGAGQAEGLGGIENVGPRPAEVVEICSTSCWSVHRPTLHLPLQRNCQVLCKSYVLPHE